MNGAWLMTRSSRPNGPGPGDGCGGMHARWARVDVGESSGAIYVAAPHCVPAHIFFFLSLLQLIFVQSANLITKHAATKAVRAAAVVLPDDPAYYGGVPVGSFSGQRKTDIARAAQFSLATMGAAEAAAAEITVEGAYARNAILTARIAYSYRCKVPWGRFAVCGLSNLKKLSAEASLTSQGADYVY